MKFKHVGNQRPESGPQEMGKMQGVCWFSSFFFLRLTMNGFPKIFVPGPGESKQIWAQQVNVSPESEQKRVEGQRWKRQAQAKSVPFDFKGAACKLYSKQHANDM